MNAVGMLREAKEKLDAATARICCMVVDFKCTADLEYGAEIECGKPATIPHGGNDWICVECARALDADCLFEAGRAALALRGER